MSQTPVGDRAKDPGVPEALPRALEDLRGRVDPLAMDSLWIFPPLRRGRRERGLVAVSVYIEGGERRSLLTASYLSERSGLDLTFQADITPEGDAPPELLPGIMQGVVRRGGEGLGEPRLVVIEGDPARFEDLLGELRAAAQEGSAA